VVRDAIHVAADGKRYLVTHGDQFDGVIEHARWLAFAGDWGYRVLLAANTAINRVRRKFGFGYWSFSAAVKVKVKNALQFIENFERAVADEARRRGVDGVICGHIHKAEMRDIDGIRYINDGDWVESCTAVVEHPDGRFEILDWSRRLDVREPRREVEALPAPAPLGVLEPA
jgi:UDP-2,3-diacylglucosamine pyrophosphatase LpxH